MTSDKLLESTEHLDHEAPAVREFVARVLASTGKDKRDRAVALYYAVRDEIFYEIYNADLSRDGLKASETIRAGRGLCIHKSIVYAAAVRAVGIPSRLVLADARNHLTSERLRRFIGGDVFHFHCLVSIFLNGQWMKVTPVFNYRLCALYRLRPLEFDGTSDSLHHPYDSQGRKYMEFVHEHGEFDDFPYDYVVAGLRNAHPNMFDGTDRFRRGSLELEAPVRSASGRA